MIAYNQLARMDVRRRYPSAVAKKCGEWYIMVGEKRISIASKTEEQAWINAERGLNARRFQ